MRIGAFDLLAPPAGKDLILFDSRECYFMLSAEFRIGILGFLTYKRAMSELSFQEVYITDPLHIYTLYIHTVCVYTGYFFRIFGHFYDFLGFLRFFKDFYRFYWIFYFSF